MTSIEMYEKKVLELFHMYANGDIDIREFLTTIHNFYYKVEEMYKLEMAQLPQQETLYTEEQMIGFSECILNSDSKKVLTRTKESLLKEYIYSLKQPKKN